MRTVKNEKEFKMSLSINTNMAYLRATNAFNAAGNSLNTSLQRLTTGYRINSAADDPAGYYYASELNNQLSGMRVAYSNVQMGYNMAQTAVGDLQSINDELERIRDLATMASNETLTDAQKTEIINEAQSRIDEINRLAKDSSFGDIKLLDGSVDAGTGVRIQIGANSDPTLNSLQIKNVFLKTDTDSLNITGSTAMFATVEEAFATASAAAQFIDQIDAASDIVKERVSNAGVAQNRMDSILASLNTKYENYTAAYSTVMEADIATETANYTRNMILQQTASSMMAQANTRSMLVLSLLPQ